MANVIRKNGNCYLCGKELGKTVIKRHLVKEHLSLEKPERISYILKVEDKYDKNYWLYLCVLADSELESLDDFLRRIWLECCEHASAFMQGGKKYLSMSTKVSEAFESVSRLYYEYDFGSTTELIISNLGTYYVSKNKKDVELLARNIPDKIKCDKCENDAVYFKSEDYSGENDVFLCEDCYKEFDNDEYFMCVTNSPRMGVCGYGGELDIYEFDANKIKKQCDENSFHELE